MSQNSSSDDERKWDKKMPGPIVVSELPYIRSELADLDLERQKLNEVVDYADRERSFCTINDVKGFHLGLGYAKAARALRDHFCGEVWEVEETDNQAGIRHKHRSIRVIPMNFDENAGNPDETVTPRPAKVKGSATKKKIRCNETGWLPGLDMPEPIVDEMQTWILGFGPPDEDGFVGRELSLPLEFDGNKFSKFVKRIILDIRTEDGNEDDRLSGPNEPTETIDIPIIRK